MQHKHIPYGTIATTMEKDTASTNTDLSQPLLDPGQGSDDANIPPLNPDDPLFGLRSSQVQACREIFGKNEILVPETPIWRLFLNQFIGFLVSFTSALQFLNPKIHAGLIIKSMFIKSNIIRSSAPLDRASCHRLARRSRLARFRHHRGHAVGECLPWLSRRVPREKES